MPNEILHRKLIDAGITTINMVGIQGLGSRNQTSGVHTLICEKHFMDHEAETRRLLNKALQTSPLTTEELKFLLAVDARLRSRTPISLSDAQLRRLAEIVSDRREHRIGD